MIAEKAQWIFVLNLVCKISKRAFICVSTQNSSNANRNPLCVVYIMSEQNSHYFVVGVVFVFNTISCIHFTRYYLLCMYTNTLHGVIILRCTARRRVFKSQCAIAKVTVFSSCLLLYLQFIHLPYVYMRAHTHTHTPVSESAKLIALSPYRCKTYFCSLCLNRII